MILFFLCGISTFRRKCSL